MSGRLANVGQTWRIIPDNPMNYQKARFLKFNRKMILQRYEKGSKLLAVMHRKLTLDITCPFRTVMSFQLFRYNCSWNLLRATDLRIPRVVIHASDKYFW
jgi:hypothetical protein